MKYSILVVEDKLNVQKMLFDFLTEKGHRVNCAANGRDALIFIKKQVVDIVLLDIMMPQMDGYQFMEKLRESSETPVIMITAKQEEADIVKGFELGADDYIVKPFKINELLVRINAVLKRASVCYARNSVIKVNNLSLDKKSKELRIDEQLVDLTLAEFSLLQQLMESVEHSVSKAVLCTHLMDQGYSGSESTLKIHIRNLRQKLAPLHQDKILIEAVFGVGYRLRKK